MGRVLFLDVAWLESPMLLAAFPAPLLVRNPKPPSRFLFLEAASRAALVVILGPAGFSRVFPIAAVKERVRSGSWPGWSRRSSSRRSLRRSATVRAAPNRRRDLTGAPRPPQPRAVIRIPHACHRHVAAVVLVRGPDYDQSRRHLRELLCPLRKAPVDPCLRHVALHRI